MRWTITNDGDVDLTIERLELTWPLRNSYLEEIKRDGDTIFEGDLPAPSAVIDSGLIADLGKRTIEPGDTDTLKLKFQHDATAGGYLIEVEFAGGCSASIDVPPGPPGGGGGAFDCSKPIDALTMIWDGTQPVRVKAWKGSVGSTLLADVDGVDPAETLTVSGFAGSPNDVFWEVFAAGGSSKLGESSFHLSCSESEMDGAEDCGRRQGNGKSNSSGLVNDWLFEGMVDSDETLDCTPPAGSSLLR